MLRWWQMLFAIVILILAAILAFAAFIKPINPQYPPPRIVGVGAILFAVFAVRALAQGGCVLDCDKKEIVRWRGFMVRTSEIRVPFGDIRDVSIVGGVTGHIRYDVAIETESIRHSVRLFRESEAAQRFAKALSEEIGCELHDTSTPPKKDD
jgi:hypothetical protein